jgi:hypothetical protein
MYRTKQKEPIYFSSMTKVADYVGCSLQGVMYHFTRMKKKEAKIKGIIIIKID